MTYRDEFQQAPFEDYMVFDEFEDAEEEGTLFEIGRRRQSLARGLRPRQLRPPRAARRERPARHRPGCRCPGCRAACARPYSYPAGRAEPIEEPAAGVEAAPERNEHTRWVQQSLNTILGLRLPEDGVIGLATRSAIRDFQRREGLPVDGIVGPATERALTAAGGLAAPAEEEFGDIFSRITSGIGSTVGRVVDAVSGTSNSRIIDLTAKADKSQRKGTRDPKSVYALVLHQMACCFTVKDPLKRFLSIGSHFAILPDGRILQLHPISALVWASNGFNSRSVAVEFAGNFPNTKGKCWEAKKFGCNQVTQAQIEAGRYLVRYLIRTMGLTHILAHRQSSGTRENDPGPNIWYNVGQWAINNQGLKDGGQGFKIGTGNPIPDLWRNWGQVKPQPELEEAEIEPSSPEHGRWLQQALNGVLGLRLPTDGAISPAVRSALRSFQRRRGLPTDGELTEEIEALLVDEGAQPHRHTAGG